MTLIWRSREPAVQAAAFLALLALAVAACASLTCGQTPQTIAELAAAAYTAVVVVAVRRFHLGPLLVVLASVQIAAVLLASVRHLNRSTR